MLKTVLIDDEDLIRDGLRMTIPWEEKGFEIVGEACDGEEAIEVLQATMPDVIITDIRMPFMDGLELVEFIKPLLPDAFIIILSGHDEFHYAQKALQLGVYDFILKPFELDYFLKVLGKIKYDYTLQKKRKVRHLPPEDLIQLQENFVSSLLTDSLPEDQLTAKLEGYELIGLKDSYFNCLLVQIDNFNLTIADITFDQINEINKNYYSLIRETVMPSSKQYVIEGNNGDALIVLTGSTADEVSMKSKKALNQLRDRFTRLEDQSVTIALSQIKPGIKSLNTLYRQCHMAANQRFIIGYDRDIHYDSLQAINTSKGGGMPYPQTGYDRSHYLALIKSGDPEELTDYIHGIFAGLIKDGHNSSLFLTMFASSIYVELLNLLNGMDLSLGDVLEDPLMVYRNLTLAQNLYDTRDVLTQLSLEVSHYLKSQLTGNSRINEAKAYIEANYNSPDITLQKVAETVNMGVCYFSSIFKKETGDAFISYLTDIRIAKAKELFETTDLKTYEVSYQIGYNTPTYFSTLFKKITGMSPSDYKNNLHK